MEDARVTQDEMFGEMLVADRPNESQWNSGITYGDFIRALYAKSHAMQAGPHGLASSKSKTHDPKCSAAVSAWVRHQATAETHKQLAACRAAARTGGQAEKLRGAGQEAKAQHLEHRVASGEPLTKKDRSAKAKSLVAKRAAKNSSEKASAATEAPSEGGGPVQTERPAPRVFKKPPPKSPEQREARDKVEAALQAKERVNRAIQDYGMGSPDEISATRAYKTARIEASAAMKAAGNKPAAKKLARYPGMPDESEGLRGDAAPPERTPEVDERHKQMFEEFKNLGQEYRKNKWSDPQVAARAHERATELIAEGKKLGFDLTQGDPSKVPAGSATPETEDRKHAEEGRRIGLEGSELEAYVRSKQGKGQIHDVVEKTKHHADKPKGSGGFFTKERSKTEELTGKVGVPREKEVPEDMQRGAEEIAKRKRSDIENHLQELDAKYRGLMNKVTGRPLEGNRQQAIDIAHKMSDLRIELEDLERGDEEKKGDETNRPDVTSGSKPSPREQVQAARKVKGLDNPPTRERIALARKQERKAKQAGLIPSEKKSQEEQDIDDRYAKMHAENKAKSEEKQKGEQDKAKATEEARARIRAQAQAEGRIPKQESGESKPEHHKHIEEAKHHVIEKLLDTFVEHGGLSKDEAEKMKAEEKAKPVSEDQPSAARQRTAARVAAQKGQQGESKKEEPKAEEPKKKLTVKPSVKAPEKPTPFPTDGPFARSPSRGDRPKSVQSPSRPNVQKSNEDPDKKAEGERRQEEERAAWESRNPKKLTPEQEKARKAEGRKAGEEMRKRHEAEYAAGQAKRDEEFQRGEEKHNPQPAKQEPSGYDEHGRERAIVKAIQKIHGGEPVDDRGMMIERIAKESGLGHDEAWKTILEMADRGALEFDPLEDTEAELSKQYGAKTYQPHHLRGKHANVVRLMRPHKLNIPLDKSERSQYAMARESLRRFIA